MKYEYTTNLGNEIQSIAARQFLPKIDCYIEHEKLNLFKNSEKVKFIMNGWYLDCIKSWPPSDAIDPLLISMHFNTSFNNTKEIISKPESRDFFSSYGPVGCRDISTAELLNNLNIDSYYSGDLTLTLQGRNIKNENKYIVVNALNSKEIVEFLKTKTNIPIYEIQHETIQSYEQKYLERRPFSYTLTSFYSPEEKFFIAENFLKIYEGAHCIITDKIHCAFPALAFGVPVLFFDTAFFAPERLRGMGELVLKSNLDEYKENYTLFDVENPPKNSKKYLKIRRDLINKTKEFTGYFADCYDSDYSQTHIMNMQSQLLAKTGLETRKYMKRVINLVNGIEKKVGIAAKNKTIFDLHEQIIEYKQIVAKQNDEIKLLKNIVNNMKKSDEN